MTISAVGSAITGTAVTTLSLNPGAVGHAFVLYVKIPDNTHTVSSVSGGNCTWVRIAGPTIDTNGTAHTHEVWLGTATATGANTVTVTNSGATTMDLDAQEFSSTFGTTTVWSRDGTQSGFSNNASSITITYPTLVPSGTYAYVGHARCPSGGTLTTLTTGYTSQTDANGNQFLYNPAASGSQSPTGTSTVATLSFCIGVIVKDAAPSVGWDPSVISQRMSMM